MVDVNAPYGRGVMTPAFTKASYDPDARISSLHALGQVDQEASFDSAEARNIYIRGLGITNADDRRPVLATNGMGPCVAVALYNPQTKTAALAHFDTNTDVRSLHRMMDIIGRDQPVEVHLSGGQDISRKLVRDIVSTLADYPQAMVKSAAVMTEPGTLKSLAIDARNGEVATQFFSAGMDKGPDRTALMGLHAGEAMTPGPLRTEYNLGEIPAAKLEMRNNLRP